MPSFLKQLGCWVGVHDHRKRWAVEYDQYPDKDGNWWLGTYRDQWFTCTRCGKVKYRLERIV